MDISELYHQKLTTAEEAVKRIPTTAAISMGMRAATPPALLTALAQRVKAHEIAELKVYYLRCGDVALQTIFQEDLLDTVIPYSSMMTQGEDRLAKSGFEKSKKHIQYLPISFSRYPNTIKKITALDAFLVTVAPMDKFGFFNFGINGDYGIELSRHAKHLIVEENKYMPRTTGSTLLHISEVAAIVTNHQPLIEEPPRASTEIDKKIGEHIVGLIPDGATIQMGIGGVPNAVCQLLRQHKNLGIHTEVMTAGLIDLIQCGAVTNTHKTLHPYVNVFTFAIGDRTLYDFIDNNPAMMCLPVSYVNEPQIIAKNKNMISVNAFIEIDFSGQVNAEFIDHQFSGVGGQLDFVRGAYYSDRGKSFLASSSTAQHGSASRIVPRLHSVTTDTRLDVDYVVTEYGCRQLAGKSTTERTHALISLAHPQFRDELLYQAKEQHFI